MRPVTHRFRLIAGRTAIISAALLTAALLLFSACGPTLPSAPPGSRPADTIVEKHLEPSWIQEGLIYELFVRDFTPEGSFRAIIPRLDEIRELGVETIWLMPIHPIGEVERKGGLGSPYSIRDYYAVDPAYGSDDDFRALVDAVHEKGMHIIIDLVVNHTAWDHPWIDQHPDWYTRDASGNIVPPVADWSDVADLNFANAELRAELTEVMKYWVAEFDIDGYRVDTASMIPKDFWEESIPQVKAIKPVLFLGETGDVGLRSAGYQLIYAWSAYGNLKDAWRGAGGSVFVASIENEEKQIGDAAFLRFTTNHDETAWDAAPPALFRGQDGAMAAAVAHLFMPGVPLLYNGQEIGNEDSWAFFEKWNYDWSQNPEVRRLYARLGEIWQDSDALRFGDMRRIRQDNGSAIISYVRRSETGQVMVLVNKTGEDQSFTLPEEFAGEYRELFSGELMNTAGTMNFGPWEYRVFELR
jgi:glycosidase